MNLFGVKNIIRVQSCFFLWKTRRILLLILMFFQTAALIVSQQHENREKDSFTIKVPENVISENKTIKIGVLANRGYDACMREWGPTAGYLGEKLAPLKFEIVPLGFGEILTAAAGKKVSYITANPSYYVFLEEKGLAYRIATMQVPGRPNPQVVYGGVIFTKSTRSDIMSFRDLKGKVFSAVEINSLGGWHAALMTLRRAGMDPLRDFSQIIFSGTHDAVVYAVLSGKADAGTVRSTQLERMAEEKLISLDDIKVIGSKAGTQGSYPYMLSTQLYPEWPFASLIDTCPELNRAVSISLLLMEHNDPAALALHSAGWAIPQDYSVVHELLRELRLPPYEAYGKVTFSQIARQYWFVMAAVIAAVILMIRQMRYITGINRELRKASRSLAESERSKSVLLSNIPGMAYRCRHDRDWTMEFVSEGCRELTGYAPGDFINNSKIAFNDIIMPEYREYLWEKWKEIIAGKKTLRESYRIITAGGTEKWVWEQGVAVYGSNGGVEALEGIIIDLTDKMDAIGQKEQALIALRESEEKYRLLINNTNESIYVVQDMKIVFANRRASEMLGKSGYPAEGRAITDLLPPEEKNKTFNYYSRLSESAEGTGESAELMTGLPGEAEKWILANSVKILWDGKPAVLTFAIDITERKAAEEALERRIIALTMPIEDHSSINFSELFSIEDIQKLQDEFSEATGVGSIITYPDGRPITRPSRFCRLCMDIIRGTGKGLDNCLLSDSRLGSFHPGGTYVNPCMSGGLLDAGANITVGSHHIANWLIGQVRDEAQDDSSMREYAASIGADPEKAVEAFHEITPMPREQFMKIAQMLHTLANQLSYYAYQNVQQARFISELKRAEEERRKIQAQLIQAQKMESVGRLAGGVAHDFNNMLSVIIGYSDLSLENMDETNPIFPTLREIKNAAERSAELTRQLLAFARKQSIMPKIINLNEEVEGMLKMLERLIGEDISLRWHPGRNLHRVKMDISQLNQILANLCINSRDAISSTGTITIATENRILDRKYCSENPGFLPGEYAALEVADTGCGMDSGMLDKLFEPFFTTKETGKGTGLGLAMVYGIVKQNNGFIKVKSAPGEGTSFTIFFPACRETAEPLSLPAEGLREKPLYGRNRAILLVEDEPSILAMTAAMLERLGFRVIQASSPEEAILLTSRDNDEIHLLMTDVIMPEMNGRELAERLRSVKPGLKCLFMSGYTDNIIGSYGVLDSGTHFIQKPFSFASLSRKITEILE